MLTFVYPSSLLCLLLFFGSRLDTDFCIPLLSTSLAFVVWQGAWILVFVYQSCLRCLFMFFGKHLDTDFGIPFSSTLLAFVLWDTLGY